MSRTDPRLNADTEYRIDTTTWPQLLARLDGAITPCRPGTTPGREWESTDPNEQRRAAQLCHACAVIDECRAWALADPRSDTVRGGLTTAQQKRAKRARRQHPSARTRKAA